MGKYGLRLDDKSLPHMIERAKKAEAAGFEALFAGELMGTPFVNCAAVASSTSQIKLGTSIAYAFVRSPMTTALTALDLDRLTNGRFILGLGVSLPRLIETWHNMPYGRPAPHVKECIQVIRQIMQTANLGKPIKFKGEYYDMNIVGWQRPWKPVREHIPIFLGAVREGMVRAAAESADGLLGHPVLTLKYYKEVVLPNIEKGLAKAGKNRKDFQIWPQVDVLITKNRKEALDIARGTPVFYSTIKSYEPFFALHGFQKEAKQIQEIFRTEGWSRKMSAVVSDELAGTFVVIGTADEVREKIKEFEEFSDGVVLSSPTQALPRAAAAPYEDALFEVFGR